MRVHHCSFPLLLFLCLFFFTDAKRQPGQLKPRQPPSMPQSTKRLRNRSVPVSGELTTEEGHRCIWQRSGEVLVTLQVNCSTEPPGDQPRYWCHYTGKPDLCQVYSVKSSQYWKQLVGKLKKRQNACEGEKVLKAKMCKKAPAEAHMKLAQRCSDVEKAGGKTKRSKKNEEEEKRRTGFEEEGMMNDMQQEESYCSEEWKSICSLFLKIFGGN